MNIRLCLILVWLVAGLQLLSAAQNSAPQDPPAQTSGDAGAVSYTHLDVYKRQVWMMFFLPFSI